MPPFVNMEKPFLVHGPYTSGRGHTWPCWRCLATPAMLPWKGFENKLPQGGSVGPETPSPAFCLATELAHT